MSTAEHSYIIFDNNTIDKLADEVVIEVNSNKASESGFQNSLGRGVRHSLDRSGMVRIHVSTSIYSLKIFDFCRSLDFVA